MILNLKMGFVGKLYCWGMVLIHVRIGFGLSCVLKWKANMASEYFYGEQDDKVGRFKKNARVQTP